MLSKAFRQCKRKNQIAHYVARLSVSNVGSTYSEVNFDSISAAYGYKSTRELLRGWFVFKLCSYSSLVNHLSQLFTFSRAVLGQRLFEYVMRSTLYGHFVAGTNSVELKPIVDKLHKHNVKLILDYCMESDVAGNDRKKSVAAMSEQSVNNIYYANMLKSIKNVQTAAELCGTSAVTAIKITAFIPPDILQKLNHTIEQEEKSIEKRSILEYASSSSAINTDDLTEIKNLLSRVDRIVQEVKNHRGKILIDAEQSYFQTAIHKLVLELQEKYNQDNFVVYNTYQCYRKNTLHLLRNDLMQSKNNNFHLGVKLVRGAYMDQERKRATMLKINDPIHPNFEATTESYHCAFVESLQYARSHGNQVHLFVASHNENTVQFAIKKMNSMNIKRDDGLVSFATLFGMCDYLTFPLAAIGYDAYKLTPYGPVHRLLPYLTRRAQENRAIFAKAEKDRRLHYKALKGRL